MEYDDISAAAAADNNDNRYNAMILMIMIDKLTPNLN